MGLMTLLKAGSAIALLAVAAPLMAQEKGGSLKVVLDPEPPTAVAGLSGLGSAQILSSKIYEGLVDFDTELNPRPWLAESWDISADGLTYTFHLAQGVTWHDGKPFVADDVLASWEIFKAENPRLTLIAPKIGTLAAPDAHTVVFTFKEAVPGFLWMLDLGTLPVLPAHLYAGKPFKDNPANAHPVGTGPFLIEEWKAGAYIKLKRNPNYRDGSLPYLDSLFFVLIPDAQGRAVAFEQGAVDVISASNLEAYDIPRLAGLEGVDETSEGWELFAPHAFYWMNTQKAPLDNPKLRQAMTMAIDTTFIKDVVFNGFGKEPAGIIDSRTRFFPADVPATPFDPEAARALVAESGYDGTVLKLLVAPVGSSWQRLAEYQVQAWADVGVNVKIEATDAGGWVQKLSDRSFDIGQTYLYQYGDPSVGVTRNFYAANDVAGSPWNNVSGYRNPEVDALMAAADSTADPAERAKLYAEVQARVNADAPVGQLLELDFPTLYRANVKDLITSGTGLSDSFARVWIDR